MERRSVLKSILTILGISSLISLLYPLGRFFMPSGLADKVNKLMISKSEIPPGTAKEVIFNEMPVVIINRRGKGYIALSRVCTHLGCLVGYDKEEEQLVCPCHAGLFNLEGNVVAGPAPLPLKKIPLDITGDSITLG